MTETYPILVAVDFSDLSPRVMTYAARLATAWNARLLVVHVVRDLADFIGLYQTDASYDELQQRIEAEAQDRLEALCQQTLGDRLPYDTLVVIGRPVVALQRLIRDTTAECLVIGAHGTDKLEHQLFGSTAARLLDHIACPVLVIPPGTASEFISRG